MILAELIRLPSRLAWTVGCALLLALALIVLSRCALDNRRAAQEARGAATMAQGRTQAAQDASAIRDRSDARQAETSTIVKEGSDEIRNAPDRSAADAAARRRVCILTGCSDPGCALLDPHPCRVD